MDATLHCAIQMVKMMQQMTHGEATFGVANRDRFEYYAPGRQLDFGIKVGDPVKEGSLVHVSITQPGVHRREQSAAVYGVRYLAFGMQLTNPEGEVVGALVSGLPLDLEDAMQHMASDLAAAMEQFSATYSEITAIAGNGTKTAGVVEQTAQAVGQALSGTGAMTGSISRIADRIRLLGLNASIEAAHAGKAGTGFAVVAREIQALSDQSLKAVQQIVEMLSGLSKQTEGLVGAVDLLHDDSKRLQGSLNEAQSYVERLAAMAETMQNLSARRGAQ